MAEEALAVALYAVLATAPGRPTTAAGAAEAHFRAAIAVAVNHSGDSDSTASIAGNILGAYYGEQCLPADWLEALEAPEVIRGMASEAGGRHRRLNRVDYGAGTGGVSHRRSGAGERDVVAGLADVLGDQSAALQEAEDGAAEAEPGESLQRGRRNQDRQQDPRGRGQPRRPADAAAVDTAAPMPWANRLRRAREPAGSCPAAASGP